MRTATTLIGTITLAATIAALASSTSNAAPRQSGYGFGSGGGTRSLPPGAAGDPGAQSSDQPAGDAPANAGGQATGGNAFGYQQPTQSANGLPPGVGYNNSGGELSRADLQAQAIAPEYHLHMAGPTAADAVGSGGGPALAADSPAPGYVQAKFVHPYGNAVVTHHYGPGYPPPLGQGGGPNDGNAAGLIANGTVAGNPDLVNWGMTPAWDAEEIGNGAWFGSAGSNSSSPMPYIGGFND